MNELKLNHPSEEHGDDWWIFQEYVERLNDGDVLDEDEVDEMIPSGFAPKVKKTETTGGSEEELEEEESEEDDLQGQLDDLSE